MRHLIFSTAFLTCAGFTMLACGGGTNVNVSTAGLRNSAATMANSVSNAVAGAANSVSGATTSSPESFMKDAAQGGMAEVRMGELAAKNAKDPEIKKFGQMMVTDHGAAGKDLEALAKTKNVTLPTDIGSHQATYDKLSKMTGDDFDRYYVEQMVGDHEGDLKEFQKQAQNSSDADVKAFAAKGAQMIQKHLDAIKAIQAKMKK